MKEAVKLLERWLKDWKTDSDSENEKLMSDTMRYIRKVNRERFVTKKEEMLDWALNEVVNVFCPADNIEKKVYANAAALTNNYLEEEYRSLVSERVKKFMLEDNRDDKTMESMA